MTRLPPIPAKVPLDAADFDAERREAEAAALGRIDAAALFAAIPADRYAEAQAPRPTLPPSPPQPRQRTAEQRQLDHDAKRLFEAIPDEIYGAFEAPKPRPEPDDPIEPPNDALYTAMAAPYIGPDAPAKMAAASTPPRKHWFSKLHLRWP